jgi:hypothetical protein
LERACTGMDAGRVCCHHCVVCPAIWVTGESVLHLQAAVVDQREETLKGHEGCAGAERGVLAQRVTRESGSGLDHALGLQVGELCHVHQSQCGL